MRTTIDIPDDLFRRVKARAALDGLKLKELIARFVADGLASTDSASHAGSAPRRRSPLPLVPEAVAGATLPEWTNADLYQILEDEDASHGIEPNA